MKPEARRRAAWCAAAALALLCAVCAFQVSFGAEGDDCLHVLLARALRSGNYALPGGPPLAEPWPGLPLSLVLVETLAAPHWGLLRLFALFWAAAAALAGWQLARRLLAPESAARAGLLAAAAPVFVLHAGAVMPDFPALALSAASFVALDRGSLGSAAACAAAAGLMRPQGAAAALACAAALAWGGKKKDAAKLLALAWAPLALWTARNRFFLGAATGYEGSLASRWSAAGGTAALPAHFDGLLRLAFGLGLAGFASSLAGALLLAAAVWGWNRLDCRRPAARAALIYGILQLVLLCVWPVEDPRYLVPILPLVAAGLVAAADALPRAAGRAALIALAAAALRPSLEAAARRPWAPATAWPEGMSWLRAHAPEDSLVETMDPAAVALLSGRRAVTPRIAASAEDWARGLKEDGVRFVQFAGTAERWNSADARARALVARRFEWALDRSLFRPAYKNPNELFAVYERIK